MNADESRRLYAGVELHRIGKPASSAQCDAPRAWRVKIDCFGEGSSSAQPTARKAIPFRVHRPGASSSRWGKSGKANDNKAYYPGAVPLRVQVTGDRRSGRLLGGQILGNRRAEISKRIDIFATALIQDASVEYLNDLDLTYPPNRPHRIYTAPVSSIRRDERVDQTRYDRLSSPSPASR